LSSRYFNDYFSFSSAACDFNLDYPRLLSLHGPRRSKTQCPKVKLVVYGYTQGTQVLNSCTKLIMTAQTVDFQLEHDMYLHDDVILHHWMFAWTYANLKAGSLCKKVD